MSSSMRIIADWMSWLHLMWMICRRNLAQTCMRGGFWYGRFTGALAFAGILGEVDMIIWIVLAMAVLVIGASGLVGGRRYQNQRRSGSNAGGRRHRTHHGQAARNRRGRGRAR
jgi:hypothetical protein